MIKVLKRILSLAVPGAWVCLLLVVGSTSYAATEPSPLKILLLTGANNHNWQETTPVLVKTLQASGAFTVDVTEDPAGITPETLAPYQAIVSNWTNWPSKERTWGTTAETAFLDFVRQGKGVVFVHAASACFYTWPAYQQLVGGTWGPDTGHGPIHRFAVDQMDPDHPITRGMSAFTTKDELWHRVPLQPSARVLCRAFSAKDKGGTGHWEPAALATEFGRGRSFYLILGHDAQAMQFPGFVKLLLRGTEWAATGKVNAPPERHLSWEQTDRSVALVNSGSTVWQLNFARTEGKPYTLKKGKTLVLKYRILIHGPKVDREFLNAQWQRYAKP